ncbi:MAG: virulence protein [Rhodanobacteraceae bacterium]|nr:MAG: virulence protein [Rhodanobacteraceae bacterium]
MWVGACAIVLAGCATLWNPFGRPSLARSTIVLQPPPGVTAPAGRGDVLTILYSGDGGWADLDKRLGTVFAARGIPVIGINSFKYFWRARSPDIAAEQLDTLIATSLAKYHKQRVWLVGFSFGADALPSLIDRLPAATRARITQLVLLSPSRDITFEIQFEGYMMTQGRIKAFVKTLTEKFNPVPQYPAMPAVVALDNQFPVACFYGLRDKDESLCTQAGLPGWVKVDGRPGGHHFKEGYVALAGELLAALPASSADAPNARTARAAEP